MTIPAPEFTPIPVMKPWLGVEEVNAVAETLASGWIAQGPRVAAFESAVAKRLGAVHGVATSSCTTALQLALIVAGVGTCDEVIVPSLSFIATANVVIHVGATPVFADVDVDTLNLTTATVEAALTPRTRAVILVHQAGTPADIDAIHSLCDPLGIAVLEDAACAIGSEYRGRPIGSHTDLVAISFHPRKIITTGEGGMLLCSRDDWAARARRLREHGMSLSAADRHASSRMVIETYDEVGFNSRMTDMQAAVGMVQLSRLDKIIARRRFLGARYRESLIGASEIARTAADPSDALTNFQSFWVELSERSRRPRNEALSALSELGIGVRRGIMAAHMEPAYAGRPSTPLPVTERMTARTLILPLYHEMTIEQQDYVVSNLLDVVGSTS